MVVRWRATRTTIVLTLAHLFQYLTLKIVIGT